MVLLWIFFDLDKTCDCFSEQSCERASEAEDIQHEKHLSMFWLPSNYPFASTALPLQQEHDIHVVKIDIYFYLFGFLQDEKNLGWFSPGSLTFVFCTLFVH